MRHWSSSKLRFVTGIRVAAAGKAWIMACAFGERTHRGACKAGICLRCADVVRIGQVQDVEARRLHLQGTTTGRESVGFMKGRANGMEAWRLHLSSAGGCDGKQEVRVCVLACAGGGWGATRIHLLPIASRTEALACQPSSFTASSWGSRATRRGSRARLAANRQMAIVSGCIRWARGLRGTGEIRRRVKSCGHHAQ